MLKASIDTTPRARRVARSNRIVLLEAALELAQSENAKLRRRDAALRAELGRLRAENRRLRAAHDGGAMPPTADTPQRGAHEMTAGTSLGPRRMDA